MPRKESEKKKVSNSSANFHLVVNHYVDLEDKKMHEDIHLQCSNKGEIDKSKYVGKPIIIEGKYKMIWDPTIIIPTIPEVKFFICQSEIAPKTGRPHLQCYFELNKKTTSLVAQKLLQLPHDVPQFRQKTREHGINYVTKEKTRDPLGIFYSTDDKYNRGKGRRTDITIISDEIKLGMRIDQVMDKYPSEYNRYNKFIKDACLKYSKKRTTYPEVIIRYGTSGTGKSESWFNLQKENADEVFVLQFNDVPGKLWFDGYYQQKYCVFEEFKPSKMDITTLLTFLDKGMKTVEYKGASTQFNSPIIIITSNTNPLEWYKNANDEHRLALIRRLSDFGKVYHHRYGTDPHDRTPLIKSIAEKYRSSAEERRKAIERDDEICNSFALFTGEQDCMDENDRINNDDFTIEENVI